MPIYTRTGDKGKTSLFDGTRIFKSHIRVETYGTIDELNSMLGLALAFLPKSKQQTLKSELENIQHDLFAIGSAMAFPYALPVVGLEKRPKDFEKLIDQMTAKLPELKNFILPGGGKAGAQLHVCRTIARRAERQLVKLMQEPPSAEASAGKEVDSNIVIYLNRLSDLLFTMARFVNFQEKQREIIWKK